LEEKLKQRVVGAVVLVALAVIFIPMILESPGDGGLGGEQLPPAPSVGRQPMQPRDGAPSGPGAAADGVALAPPGQSGNSAGKAPDQGGSAAADSPAPASAPRAGTADNAQPGAAGAPEPSKDTGAPASTGGGSAALTAWVVQVGSFSQQDNASGLRDKLRAKGYKAFVEQAQTSAGTVYRVEVGPVLERSAAESLRQKLHQELKLDGLVTAHR